MVMTIAKPVSKWRDFLVWAAVGALYYTFVVVAAVGALLAAVVANAAAREGWAFGLSGVSVVALTAALFIALFPDVMPSSLDPRWSLTAESAASNPYTLKIMTWCAALATPVVLLYQGWTYWVFRKRIGTRHIAENH